MACAIAAAHQLPPLFLRRPLSQLLLLPLSQPLSLLLSLAPTATTTVAMTMATDTKPV